MRMEIRKLPLCIISSLLLLVAACSNPFKETYVSKLERWPSGQVDRLLPPEGEARLVTSLDIKGDAQRMFENGYLLLGRSTFRGTTVNFREATEVADDIGASVVMVEKKYAETVTESVPMSEWIPERTVTIKERGVITSGPDRGQTYENEKTKTLVGEFRTTYVPQTTEYYDFAATYWAKLKPSIFGVIVTELDAEARRSIESNRGVLVKAVIGDSPAFVADLLSGDVITAFGGEGITGPDQFFDLVLQNKGRTVTVNFSRGGVQKSVSAHLRTE